MLNKPHGHVPLAHFGRRHVRLCLVDFIQRQSQALFRRALELAVENGLGATSSTPLLAATSRYGVGVTVDLFFQSSSTTATSALFSSDAEYALRRYTCGVSPFDRRQRRLHAQGATGGCEGSVNRDDDSNDNDNDVGADAASWYARALWCYRRATALLDAAASASASPSLPSSPLRRQFVHNQARVLFVMRSHRHRSCVALLHESSMTPSSDDNENSSVNTDNDVVLEARLLHAYSLLALALASSSSPASSSSVDEARDALTQLLECTEAPASSSTPLSSSLRRRCTARSLRVTLAQLHIVTAHASTDDVDLLDFVASNYVTPHACLSSAAIADNARQCVRAHVLLVSLTLARAVSGSSAFSAPSTALLMRARDTLRSLEQRILNIMSSASSWPSSPDRDTMVWCLSQLYHASAMCDLVDGDDAAAAYAAAVGGDGGIIATAAPDRCVHVCQ